MPEAPAQRFLAYLREIVRLLEGGDRGAAAAAAAEMRSVVAGLAPEMAESDLAEAKKLMERYAALGERLNQDTLASIARLGAARRVAAYGRRARRP